MRRGKATFELLVLLGVAFGLSALMVVATGADGGAIRRHLIESIPGHRPDRRDDRWALRSDPYGPVIRRYAPTMILERDRFGEDAAVPSDPGVCRRPWCAAFGTGRPTIFTHLVRVPGSASSGGVSNGVLSGVAGGASHGASDGGVTYVEYWFYYPDSKTLHVPLGSAPGDHRDDWEGMIVRIPDDGEPAARVTAHQGLVGVARGWSAGAGGVVVTADPGWHPISDHPTIFRAAGSHANGFTREGIDMPLDNWNVDLGRLPWSTFTLIAADTAPALRFRYDPSATPPWMKALWSNPESTSTGRAALTTGRPRGGSVRKDRFTSRSSRRLGGELSLARPSRRLGVTPHD
ncbi:MAG: hypothetical protein ACR2J9_09390 [Gaiellales bacterium]